MTKLFGIPMGILAVVLVATLVAALSAVARRRGSESHLLPAGRAERQAPARPQRADRRRADARHRDHRRRARHGRHHDADDPLLGDLVARPDRRARGGARRDARASQAAGRVRRPACGTSPRPTSPRCGGQSPGRGSSTGSPRRSSSRSPCRLRDEPPERAPGDALRQRRSGPATGSARSRPPTGSAVSLAALRPGWVYLNRDGADKLDASAGDTLRVFAGQHGRRGAGEGDRLLRRRRHRRRGGADAAPGGAAAPRPARPDQVRARLEPRRRPLGRRRDEPGRAGRCGRRSRPSAFRRTRPSGTR